MSVRTVKFYSIHLTANKTVLFFTRTASGVLVRMGCTILHFAFCAKSTDVKKHADKFSFYVVLSALKRHGMIRDDDRK